MLNGTASAVPATLVLFFIRDRLQAPAQEGAFLAAYFVAAALSLPLWVRAMAHFGLARGWRAGMLLSIASFAGAVALGPGDDAGFFAICLASGAALGADLVAPPALLAAVIRGGNGGSAAAADPAAASFGWWNLASKLNLALAAGLGLPLLARWGYAPGQRDAQALQALQLGYAALPCALKLGAVLLLTQLWIRREPTPRQPG
jgi:Na+/melibiose symporter-like transporter